MENLQVKKGKARPPRLVELFHDGLDRATRIMSEWSGCCSCIVLWFKSHKS